RAGADETGDTRAASARDRDRKQQRTVVDAFLAAARAGDLQGVLAILDPEVSFRADAPALGGGSQQLHGAGAVAPLAMRGRARAARPMLINGAVGVVVAPRGHLMMLLELTIRDGKI